MNAQVLSCLCCKTLILAYLAFVTVTFCDSSCYQLVNKLSGLAF